MDKMTKIEKEYTAKFFAVSDALSKIKEDLYQHDTDSADARSWADVEELEKLTASLRALRAG